MKVKIEIECDVISEVISHLTVIKKQIKDEAKKKSINLDDDFPKRVRLFDSNCYGDHKVNIQP